MRICFIALGRFAHVDAYLDYFREQGHEVHFVALAPGPRREVPTHNVGFKAAGKWSYLPAMWRASKVIRSLHPDIVHAHYATSAGLAAYVCGVHPYLVTAHGTDVTLGARSPVWRPILRTILRDADCVNTVSKDLSEIMLGLGVPAEKIMECTPGIDTSRFEFRERPFFDPAQPLRLICTRALHAVYDHSTILKGLALLKTRQIRFHATLVGDGPLRHRLEAMAHSMGIGDQVTFTGAVDNQSLSKMLLESQLYLSASIRDGTSLSLLEALASGNYPIVSDIKANAEWIQHGHNGLLHRVSDPRSLADCLSRIVREPGNMGAVLLSNRHLVVKRADRAANMRRLESAYRKLARGPSPRPRSAGEPASLCSASPTHSDHDQTGCGARHP